MPRDAYEAEKDMLQAACVRPGAMPRVGFKPEEGVDHYVDTPVV